MDLTFTKPAAKALKAIQPKAARALVKRLARIADDPFATHANVESLKGAADTFRLRQGNRRAVFVVDRALNRLRVIRITSRGDAYR